MKLLSKPDKKFSIFYSDSQGNFAILDLETTISNKLTHKTDFAEKLTTLNWFELCSKDKLYRNFTDKKGNLKILSEHYPVIENFSELEIHLPMIKNRHDLEPNLFSSNTDRTKKLKFMRNDESKNNYCYRQKFVEILETSSGKVLGYNVYI